MDNLANQLERRSSMNVSFVDFPEDYQMTCHVKDILSTRRNDMRTIGHTHVRAFSGYGRSIGEERRD